MGSMWRATIGVKPVTAPKPKLVDDDDWETDPDFVTPSVMGSDRQSTGKFDRFDRNSDLSRLESGSEFRLLSQ
ncbi:unnamed protein product [Anisakis simplex]|uniref:AGC-kinase C-terminal domain-containing protein n=1 Tax=Anisakis simplex TaxID=6269 RepID=A0A0M3JGE0_ANISI|nr:unnamed protein product [Anisakis simplex]